MYIASRVQISGGQHSHESCIAMPPGVSASGGSTSTSLSITNPLVLYRALIATKKLRPDPAQHRLALQLQKLYYRLKDYSPEVDYRYRLEQVSRTIPASNQSNGSEQGTSTPHQGMFRSILSSISSSKDGSILALTRTVPIHDSALDIDSPKGMLLYGEVGRGKSMLLDLLYGSLPSRKKQRWHFNSFMLDIFRRVERERIVRTAPSSVAGVQYEHCILSLAKDTVNSSPIIFLDEFQMPDRASSKLLNGFMTAFFHLGGVLVASSNRMPDELAKASGIDFSNSRLDSRGRGVFGWGASRHSEGEKDARSDFGKFLDVLRARCEVWEMEGERDWRRDDGPSATTSDETLEDGFGDEAEMEKSFKAATLEMEVSEESMMSSDAPKHYHIMFSADSSDPEELKALNTDIAKVNSENAWVPQTLHIYKRALLLPTTHPSGVVKSSFAALCATYLGPADYISLASTFHTLVLTDIPVLTLTLKNEARRFITLLDALYECKCRLIISAAAPPDSLFFPDMTTRMSTTSLTTRSPGSNGGFTSSSQNNNPATIAEGESDSITSEAFSEMYQDSTAPFRPNISSYIDNPSSPSSSSSRSNTSVPTASLTNPSLRSVLADEDADFGPTYGNGRSHGASTDHFTQSSSSRTSFSDGPTGMSELERRQGPDFTNTSVLTGSDERFAYKRARSRLWEMCGRRWWRERDGRDPAEWWTPVPAFQDASSFSTGIEQGLGQRGSDSGRFWEQGTATTTRASTAPICTAPPPAPSSSPPPTTTTTTPPTSPSPTPPPHSDPSRPSARIPSRRRNSDGSTHGA